MSRDNGNDPSSYIQVPASVPGGRPDIIDEVGIISLASSLSRNPRKLYDLVIQQSNQPPQYYLRINGSHTESKKRVTDFDFSLDLTPTLVSPTLVSRRPDRGSTSNDEKRWREVRVVRDGDGQEAYRGGRCMSRHAPSSQSSMGSSRNGVDPDNSDVDDDDRVSDETEEGFALLRQTRHGSDADNTSKHALMRWCERFCRNDAPVKSYVAFHILLFFEQ